MLTRGSSLSIATLSFLSVAGCNPGVPPTPDDTGPGGAGSVAISVSVPRKFGADATQNGVVDMPLTSDYARGALKVTLDATRLVATYPTVWPATAGTAVYGGHPGPWRWTFTAMSPGSVEQDIATLPVPVSPVSSLSGSNDGVRIVAFSTGPTLQIGLYDGHWTVEVASVAASGTPIFWKSRNFQINDVLIAQVGDSYSSGEGAPDRTAADGFWGDDGSASAGNGTHRAAHRSSHTWGSVAAAQAYTITTLFGATAQEYGSTITYLNLAQSGAMIDDVPAQLTSLRSLIGTRKVDMLLVSIGGNDAGFAAAIAAYLLREPVLFGASLLGPDLDDIRDAIRDGHWTGGAFTDIGSVLVEMFDFLLPAKLVNVRGLDGLNAGYQQLAALFTSHGIPASAVRILQYPDPLVANPSAPDDVCPNAILTSVSSVLGRQLEIGRGEQKHARANLIVPLNQQIAASAAALGWRLVAAENVMYGHAICESDRMALRYQESITLQNDKKGTLHPNREGYKAIAQRVW